MKDQLNFCDSYFQYNRLKTDPVNVGNVIIGGDNPVIIQSMTTTNTLDTLATVEQGIKISEAGGELVRITTQGRREATNLEFIKKGLMERNCTVPLVADVHFNPAAAEIAATLIEKVRINPGNFTGGAKKFKEVVAGSEKDQEGLRQIREKLVPFLRLCQKHGTAIRIGTNHGSLSDRMMSKFGDTPEGMVESCMEYLRICKEEDFKNIVLSIKSSNTRVMVHTVRLLVAAMKREDMRYPLHLGVTEAGSGEDGRLKSAVGIGALLSDGIGDTIRVSLTEPPENEIPVAAMLVEHYGKRAGHVPVPPVETDFYSPFKYQKRSTHQVVNVGGEMPAAVVVDVRGKPIISEGMETPEIVICDHDQLSGLPESWADVIKVVPAESYEDSSSVVYPLFEVDENWISQEGALFLECRNSDLTAGMKELLKEKKNVVILLESDHPNNTADRRAFFLTMQNEGLTHPVIVSQTYDECTDEDFQLKSAADSGLLFLDGYGDGIALTGFLQSVPIMVSTGFGILQASRVRFSKTEYISCPGCGRTLFDLQSTTAKVRLQTGHLKGLKIAVMGCIVNGIGEMADADYGYVGAGPGHISLFRNRELVRKNIPESAAVEELVQLIKNNGDWHDPVD
ncbi:(E)-4-hydroxy-3-methylbut-2-enyl-diphosphate synthase [Marinilabilia salmonicolor]|uniref:(E)-4-hydroxy-3-methylbut-2-enyl-diphosphate synthase n=1 Tax=Marinilabilia salmonicolor TaxID=989 RepID=UPI00029AA288|nr:(E)-4-hydroxy-3-methylbut-2-enyl-diphosphate synthase [Marinilabilia salmonicolor]